MSRVGKESDDVADQVHGDVGENPPLATHLVHGVQTDHIPKGGAQVEQSRDPCSILEGQFHGIPVEIVRVPMQQILEARNVETNRESI